MGPALLGLIAYVFFSSGDTVGKYLTGFYPVTTIIFFNALFYFIPAGLYYRRHPGKNGLRFDRPGLMVLGGVIISIAALLLTTGFKKLPMADVYALLFSMPLFTGAMAAIILREHLTPGRTLAILTGFGAILIILQPGPDLLTSAAMLPLGAAFLFSLYNLTARYLLRTNSPSLVVMGKCLILMLSMLAAGPFMGFTLPSINHLPFFLASGILMGLGDCFIISAFNKGQTIQVLPMMFTQILWGSLYGFLFWGDVPEWSLLLGAPIVILAITYLILTEAKPAATRAQDETMPDMAPEEFVISLPKTATASGK